MLHLEQSVLPEVAAPVRGVMGKDWTIKDWMSRTYIDRVLDEDSGVPLDSGVMFGGWLGLQPAGVKFCPFEGTLEEIQFVIDHVQALRDNYVSFNYEVTASGTVQC